ERGKRVYLLVGRPGVADEAAARLTKLRPGLLVAGTHHGYFDAAGDEEAQVVHEVATASVDLLLVGMGAPKQDVWIDLHKGRLGAKVAMGVGGAIDVFADRTRRAPRVLRELGLEW